MFLLGFSVRARFLPQVCCILEGSKQAPLNDGFAHAPYWPDATTPTNNSDSSNSYHIFCNKQANGTTRSLKKVPEESPHQESKTSQESLTFILELQNH